MAYREKVAWLSLLAMGLSFGPYFAWTAISPPGNEVPNLPLMATYAVTAIGYGLLLGMGHLVLRMRSGREARLPADERDLAIERRSSQVAYYVLMGLTLYVGGYKPFVSQGWDIVNDAIAAVVIAEVVRCFTGVIGYRRSAA